MKISSGLAGRRLRTGLGRGLAFALIWWGLTEGRADSWGVGLVGLALALTASRILFPPGRMRLSLTGLLAFAWFFLTQSIKAGAQVAAMALRPRLDMAPALLELPLTLPVGLASVVLVNTLNLLPGTLSVAVEQGILRLHVLDSRLPIAEEVRMAEERIARMLQVES